MYSSHPLAVDLSNTSDMLSCVDCEEEGEENHTNTWTILKISRYDAPTGVSVMEVPCNAGGLNMKMWFVSAKRNGDTLTRRQDKAWSCCELLWGRRRRKGWARATRGQQPSTGVEQTCHQRQSLCWISRRREVFVGSDMVSAGYVENDWFWNRLA